MRIYIIRHADPDYPNKTITPDGHLEAQALARRLQGEKINKLYSSPLPRALHTMQYTADLLNLDCNVEEWTTELTQLRAEDKRFDNLLAFDYPGEAVRGETELPTHATWHQAPHLKDLPVFETFEDLKERSDAFLRRHGYERAGGKYRCLEPNEDRIAVFCHGGFGLTWIAHLLEIPLSLMWSGFWLPPSSVSIILLDQRSPEWAVPRCLCLGDTSHLYHEGLPVKPRGIIRNYF